MVCKIFNYLLLKLETFTMSDVNIGNKIKCDNEEVLQTYSLKFLINFYALNFRHEINVKCNENENINF